MRAELNGAVQFARFDDRCGGCGILLHMRNLTCILVAAIATLGLAAPVVPAAELRPETRAIERRTQEATLFVPVIFSGAGWTQQLLLQNVTRGSLPARGTLAFHQADGSPWLISGLSASGLSANYTYELKAGETLVVELPDSTGELRYGYARIGVACGTLLNYLDSVCDSVFAQTKLIRRDATGGEQMTSIPATGDAIFGFQVPFDNKDGRNTLVSILTTDPCFSTTPCTTDLLIKFRDSTGTAFHEAEIPQTTGSLRMLNLTREFPTTVGRVGSVLVTRKDSVVARVVGSAFQFTPRGGFTSIATFEDAILPETILESTITRTVDELGSDKRFELRNGQIWAQDDFQFIFITRPFPKVLVWQDGATFRMWVEGETQTIRVRRIQ